MENIKPLITQFILPLGSREVEVAKAPSMANCVDLPAIITPDGKVVSQWVPSARELEALNLGQPITLIVWNGSRPLAPVALMVGGADFT